MYAKRALAGGPLDFGLALDQDQESDACICSRALDSCIRSASGSSILAARVESKDPLWKFRILCSSNQQSWHLTWSLLIGLTTRATYSLTAVGSVWQSIPLGATAPAHLTGGEAIGRQKLDRLKLLRVGELGGGLLAGPASLVAYRRSTRLQHSTVSTWRWHHQNLLWPAIQRLI